MLEFVSLRPLLWLLIAIPLLVAVRYSLADRPRRLFWASSALSLLVVVLLVVALCRPYIATRSNGLHVNFLVDVSQSVELKQAADSLAQIDAWIRHLGPNDTWALFAVGRGVRQFESTDALRKVLCQWQAGIADDGFRSATQLARGLLTTRLAFPAGKSCRTVMLTDGQETDDDLAAALRELAASRIEVRRWPLAGISQPEAAVVSVTPSTQTAFQGETIRLSAQVAANRDMAATVRLIHRGVAVQLRPVQLRKGDTNRVELDIEMTTPGESPWTVDLQPAEDHFLVNNQASCTITVKGHPSILVLHQKPKDARPLARALREQGITVDVRAERGLPDSLEGLAAFDAIVLADIPATAFSPRQMQMVKRYVTDMGGGLVMLGSENSFGLGGYHKTPIEEVLPLISRFEKEKEKPSLALTLVIDKSGSMEGTPIALARQAAMAASELLSPQDQVGVVGFDEQPQVLCEMTSAGSRDVIETAISSLQAGGGTNMYSAMVAGKKMLEATPAKIRHMICLSDGQTQPANHDALVEEMASENITVSTVAISDADRRLMSRIAELGHGRYYETNDPANVPQIFAKETIQAAKSAIKEDVFKCVQVGDHPLLAGFDEQSLPHALGYVMTEAKPTSQLLLSVETGDPLLAVGRFGLGSGMAYTSDLGERWGAEWLAWNGCGKFWAQALRAVLRKESAEGLHAETRRTKTGWELDIRRTADDGLPVNDVRWNAGLLDSQGNAAPLTVRQTGLGRYQATFVAAQGQPLTIRLRDEDRDATRLIHLSPSYPAEYRLAQTLPEAIAALPQESSEKLAVATLEQHGRRSIVHWFLLAALTALLGSVLLRRV